MSPEQFAQLEESIKQTVVKTVNGKIDGLKTDFGNYVKEDLAWKAVDQAWKKAAQPSIDLGNNVRGWGKVNAGVFAFLVGIATIGMAVFEIFKTKSK